MRSDILVGGGANTLQLQAGDLLFSTSATETFGAVTLTNQDVALFRPDTAGDYSAGTFSLLLENPAGAEIWGMSLVERDTDVGSVTPATLSAGDFLFTLQGATRETSIWRFNTTGVGAGTTSGALTEFIAGTDAGVGIDQALYSVHLIDTDQTLGGISLSAGDILASVSTDDNDLGNNHIAVKKFDLFRLNVESTGVGTSAASASILLDGSDVDIAAGGEEFDAFTLAGGNQPPNADAASFAIDENSANGTVVGTVSGSDPEDGTSVNYTITAGNAEGAFAIDSATGEITVANSAALDFEATPTLNLTVAAIDGSGAYGTATITIDLNDVNDAPVLAGANNLTAIDEDPVTNNGDLVSTLIAGQVSDQDSGAQSGIAVTGVDDSNGTWQYDAGSGWTAFGSVSDSSTVLLDTTASIRFVPNADYAGTAGNLSFRAWDQTDANPSGSTGIDVSTNGDDTAYSSATADAGLTVNPVNDAPVNNLTGQPQTVASASVDGATDVHAADLDGDGDIDLVSTSWGDDRVTWFQNDGTGSFTEYTIDTGVTGARHAFVADIDGDTHLDVLVSDYEGDTVTWYENDGAATPTFTAHVVTSGANGAWSSYAIDMDGDGDTDVLSASIFDVAKSPGTRMTAASSPASRNMSFRLLRPTGFARSLQAIWMATETSMLPRPPSSTTRSSGMRTTAVRPSASMS